MVFRGGKKKSSYTGLNRMFESAKGRSIYEYVQTVSLGVRSMSPLLSRRVLVSPCSFETVPHLFFYLCLTG